MAVFDIGDEPRTTVTFKDADGVLANPTTVTLSIKKPNASVSTPTPVNDSPGIYHYDISLDMAGSWFVRWAGTGAVTSASELTFSVRPSYF